MQDNKKIDPRIKTCKIKKLKKRWKNYFLVADVVSRECANF